MTYQITDPKGVLVDGKNCPEGSILPATATTSQIKAFLRFGQVEVVKSSPEPVKSPSSVKELKAALAKLEIEIPEGSKKADLEKLLADALA